MALIQTLEIEDYGPFARTRLEMAPLTVIVGPNDSGKTTLLNAVRAISALSREDWPAHLPPTGPRAGRARWAITVHTSEFAVGATCTKNRSGMQPWVSVSGIRWDHETDPIELSGRHVRSVHNLPWTVLRGDISPTDEEGQEVAREMSRPSRVLGSVAMFKPVADAMRTPSLAFSSQADLNQLGPHGQGLPSLIAALHTEDPEAAVNMVRAFRGQVPTLAGYRVVPTRLPSPARNAIDPDRTEPGFKLTFTLHDGSTLDAGEVSDGVVLTLAFLALTHLPAPPSVLLVEEPENGMHPARIREVLALLRKMTKGDLGGEPTQVIATTHMPYLLDEVDPHEAFFFHRDNEGTAHCVRFADVPGIDEELQYKLLGELWAEHGEAALFDRWIGAQAAK